MNSMNRPTVYDGLVAQLAANLAVTIKQLRKDGTLAMSRANLMQVVSMRGLSFANPNVCERAFDDALASLKTTFQVYR